MSIVVVDAVGVIAHMPANARSFAAFKANPAMLNMIDALSERFRIVITADWEEDEIEHWIEQHGLKNKVSILGDGDFRGVLESVNAGGSFVSVVISNEENHIADAISLGLPVMFYQRTAPIATLRGTEPTPWSRIRARILRHAEEQQPEEEEWDGIS
jgi:hypothetical protein